MKIKMTILAIVAAFPLVAGAQEPVILMPAGSAASMGSGATGQAHIPVPALPAPGSTKELTTWPTATTPVVTGADTLGGAVTVKKTKVSARSGR